MARKKHSDSEGSLGVSILLGAVSALIGLILGMISLAAIPVTEVRELPEADKILPRTVYYVHGRERPAPYQAKERAFLAGTPGLLRLNEEELNDWASDNFKFTKPKPNEIDENTLLLHPSPPSFRITDGMLQIGLQIEVSGHGLNEKVRCQTLGTFVPTADGYAFQPVRSYVGSALLPPAVVESLVQESLFSLFRDNEDYPEFNQAWRGLSQVAVEDNALVLVRQ